MIVSCSGTRGIEEFTYAISTPLIFDHSASIFTKEDTVSSNDGTLQQQSEGKRPFLLDDLSALENHWLLKHNPTLSRENIRIDNLDDLSADLILLSPGKYILLNTEYTSGYECAKLVDHLNTIGKGTRTQYFDIVASTSPLVQAAFSQEPAAQRIGRMTDMMLRDIVSGTRTRTMREPPRAHSSGNTIDNAAHKAGAMFIQYGQPYFGTQSLSISDKERLMACAEVHRRLLRIAGAKGDYTVNAPPLSLPPVPPILVGSGAFSKVHNEVLQTLREAGAVMERVVLTQVVVTRRTASMPMSPSFRSSSAHSDHNVTEDSDCHHEVEYFSRLLQEYPGVSLCFDAFGHSTAFLTRDGSDARSVKVFNSGSSNRNDSDSAITFGNDVIHSKLFDMGAMRGSDDDIIDVVSLLCTRGHTSRIILSSSVFTRLQLRRYGGHGFNIVAESAMPLLKQKTTQRSASSVIRISDSDIISLVGGNLIRLLAWFQPPPTAPVMLSYMTCCMCSKDFQPGTQYEKFTFIYCSSVCLSKHKNMGWKLII